MARKKLIGDSPVTISQALRTVRSEAAAASHRSCRQMLRRSVAQIQANLPQYLHRMCFANAKLWLPPAVDGQEASGEINDFRHQRIVWMERTRFSGILSPVSLRTA